MLSDDDDDAGMEFRTNTTADNRTTSTITHRYNNHHGTSRCLTPASVQLLRNSLLRTYNKPHTHNMSDNTFNVTSSNSKNINNNIRNSQHAPTDDSNDNNKSHDTVTAIYHYQQQQHKIKYRALKRLDTEPIPTVRTKPHNNHNNTSSGCTFSSALPASPQRQRRQIFGTFWNTTSDDPVEAPRRHSSTRSNSEAVETTTSMEEPCTVRKPPSLHTRSKSEGFQYHHSIVGRGTHDLNTTKNYYHTSVFTSLPSPMQRLRKSSGGVYPLVQPKSILRRSNYHPHHPMIRGKAETNERDNSHIPDDGSSTNTDYDRSSSISSSTNSIPNIPNDTTTAIVTTTSHCTGSDCNSDNDANRKPLVHFDPRITITELFGRDHDRVWYSDGELNRFKYETVVTARAYFSQHPDQIVYYNQPFYDPVTKTMRKRALFNLPALANITITEQDDHGPPKSATAATTVPGGNSIGPATEKLRDKDTRTSSDDGSQQDHQQLLSLLAFENGETILRTSDQSSSATNCTSTGNSPTGSIDTIRSVLIVDHNRWILDLFVRSVRAMFNGDSKDGCGSDAVVVECAPNATVAIAIINDTIASRRREPPFDLIIAEQLPPPNQTVQQQQSTKADVANHGIGDGDSAALSYPTNTLLLSGAELLFQSLTPEYRQQILLIGVAPSSCAKSSSNQSAASASTPTPNNASVTNTVTSLSDLLWSKPPPRMDHNLCLQLNRTLQKKREQCMGGANGIQQHSGDVD